MPTAKKGIKAKGKAAKAKKGTKSAGYGSGDTRRTKTRKQAWQIYIYKCLKHWHSDMGITLKAMRIVSSFVDELYDRIAHEAVELTKLRKGKTLSAREVQAAIRVALPGELSRLAVSECRQAVAKYQGDRGLE